MTEILTIAHIRSPYGSKFGIPRQSGLADGVKAKIVFERDFASCDAVRGLEAFSHIWLIWCFSENARDGWTPTVRPPRLGGNKRMGVFATRSPFRPNPLGLSCVELESIEYDETLGPILHVKGADLLDGTPIFDIKPYVPYADARPAATGGFTDTSAFPTLSVDFSDEISLPDDVREELLTVLTQDPRPQYHDDPDRVYGMSFAGYNVKFRVTDDKLLVLEAEKLSLP